MACVNMAEDQIKQKKTNYSIACLQKQQLDNINTTEMTRIACEGTVWINDNVELLLLQDTWKHKALKLHICLTPTTRFNTS